MEFNPDIFKYPAVEYIPLTITTLALNPAWAPERPDQVTLFVLADEAALQEELTRLGIPPAGQVDFTRDLVLLTLGYQLGAAYYRGQETILLGEPLPHGYHLSTIPCHYFYKDRIQFALYNSDGGILARASLKLST